jgi:flagella basal body P-ring formation protein FlgA
MTMRALLVLLICSLAFSAFAASDVDEVDVVVPAHDIARGTLIGESDLAYKPIPVLRANTSIVRAFADAEGKEARRALRAGDLIRESDLKHPTLVAKGANVTMVFEAPGMQLTAVGRALSEGGEGDSISVLNPTSYRQVSAVVVSAGTVRVSALSAVATPPKPVAAARP